MKVYELNFCGENRIVVHPLGLPPGWTESNITPEREADALSAYFATAGTRKDLVAHFSRDLKLIETFRLI